jgi:predicted  nucleic acid-binding Zn-ribbon protein
MIREPSTEPGETTTGEELDRELDRLSLEQAIRDFEIANARVIDLTQRLIDLADEVAILREQLVGAQEALVDAQRDNAAIRASATFRVAGLARRVAARLRV